MKSTLSNNTSSFNPIQRPNADFAFPSGSQGSIGAMKSWSSNMPSPHSHKTRSKDMVVGSAHDQMLEIKGSDGDKIMILQFDNKQLQVFNDILEKQIEKSNADDTRRSKTKDSPKKTSQLVKDRHSATPEPPLRIETEPLPVEGEEGGGIKTVKTNQPAAEDQQTEVDKMQDERGRTKANPARRSHAAHITNLTYQLDPAGPAQNRNSCQSPPASKMRVQNFSPSSVSTNMSKQSAGQKRAIELTNFFQNWQEDSRISSPGGLPFESPKTRFYLGAAKYSHTKHKNDLPHYQEQNEFTVFKANTFHREK